MFFHKRTFSIICSILILVLLSGMSGAPPVHSSSDVTPQIRISTPSYPIGMHGKDSQRIPYSFKASGNFSGVITSRVFQFYTQYDEPLSYQFGPYPTNISVNSIQTSEWNELVYLPESVVNKARAMEEYAIVLKTTFFGASSSGEDFSGEASLLLLLPPASFGKSAPANGATNQPLNLFLQWNSTVGAIDYEYCFDTINNNLCDAGWTGTYRVKATLQNLPTSTTFYWQVRANNTSGGTYANNGTWWSFTTCSYPSITVTNINNSGAGSLRKAIADICPGGIINFAPSLSGKTITLASPLAIDKDMTIDGSSLSQNIKLDGANIIDILMGTTQASNSTVLITDLDFLNARQHGFHQGSGKLEIRNSYFSGNDTGIFGGPELTVFKSNFVGNYTGIVNFDTLRVDSSLFTNNGRGIYNEKVYSFPSLGKARISASVFTQNYQGGIQNRFGVLMVGDSSFIGNEAEHGGAIQSSGTATIYNSHFSGNKATQNGGGIVNGGYLVVSESTFSGNTAGNNGGAVFNGGGVDLFASTFTNNSSGNFGGGIYG
ncbi:MAG TPA: hypothetical protein VFY83_11990, partial [Anaerolineales bacterium]|nr:hypothetical protein [Anaerolineales bacterium]